MLEDTDKEVIERANSIKKFEGRDSDILEMCSDLGYTIDRTFVKELIVCDGLDDLIEYEYTTMAFYMYPDEKDTRPSGTIRRKLGMIGDEFELIALSYKLRGEKRKQETDGLIKKRIQLPRYMVTIVQATSLLNCKTNREILDCNLTEIIGMFK